MNKLILETQKNFESSCSKTPEYLAWHRLFKREFSKFLKERGATEIQIGKPNHFDASGFFRTQSGQAWYFRIEDLRWSKNSMLIRTARDFKDYTGGANRCLTFTDAVEFEKEFDYTVNSENRIVN